MTVVGTRMLLLTNYLVDMVLLYVIVSLFMAMMIWKSESGSEFDFLGSYVFESWLLDGLDVIKNFECDDNQFLLVDKSIIGC